MAPINATDTQHPERFLFMCNLQVNLSMRNVALEPLYAIWLQAKVSNWSHPLSCNISRLSLLACSYRPLLVIGGTCHLVLHWDLINMSLKTKFNEPLIYDCSLFLSSLSHAGLKYQWTRDEHKLMWAWVAVKTKSWEKLLRLWHPR